MGSYVVDLKGGGQMTVNASSPQAAMENVSVSGNTPLSGGTPTWAGGVPSGPGTGGGGNAPGNNVTYQNFNQYNQEYTNAYTAAQTAYLQSKMRLEADDLAFRKAQQAFSETLSRAQQLGVFEGQTTLAAQNQYFNQAFQQQQQQQKVTQDYLQLLSTLRGPQDYGQYLRTMASTPQGLQSLVGAAAGNQGRVPTFGVTGTPTHGVTLGGFMGQAAGGVGSAPGAPGTPGAGSTGGTSYDEYMRAAQNLPPPSQIAPQNWNAMSDTQRQLLMSMYEANGWNVTDALKQYQSSLPRFGSTSPQVGTTRLV